MAKYRGDQLYARWIHSGGTLVVSGSYRSLNWEQMQDTIDSSAGTASDKTYILGLRDVTATLGYVVENAEGTAATVARKAWAVGGSGTLEWGPEGSAVGLPKYSAAFWVTGVNEESVYDGLQEREVSLQRTGAWIANFDLSGSTW